MRWSEKCRNRPATCGGAQSQRHPTVVTSSTSKAELTEIVEKWVRANSAGCPQHLLTLPYVCPMCQNRLCQVQ